MGFIVSQSVNSSTWGKLNQFYTRIENYRLDRINGKLHTTVLSYLDKEKADLTYPEYINSTSTQSYVLGGLLEYNSQSIDLNDYNYFVFHLTSSLEVIEELFEDRYVSESYSYFDYDEEGNVVELEGWTNPVLQNIKIGEQTVTKYKVDMSPITGSLYEYSYQKVKEEYGKIFGNENIIDQI